MPSNNAFQYSKIRTRKRSAKKSISNRKKMYSNCFWNPESTVLECGIQYPGSGIHSMESRNQDCPGFPYMGRSLGFWFHAMDSGSEFRISDSWFQSLVGFQIPWAAFRILKSGIPDSTTKISRILQGKISRIPSQGIKLRNIKTQDVVLTCLSFPIIVWIVIRSCREKFKKGKSRTALTNL